MSAEPLPFEGDAVCIIGGVHGVYGAREEAVLRPTQTSCHLGANDELQRYFVWKVLEHGHVRRRLSLLQSANLAALTFQLTTLLFKETLQTNIILKRSVTLIRLFKF